jgi:hypothetical protein
MLGSSSRERNRSYTAVNRWIVRGKNALRTDRARRELSGDNDCPPR